MTTPAARRIFFYGLFMDRSRLSQMGLNPRDLEIACADGFGLRIGERATLVKSPGESCWGLVVTLEQAEIDSLYSDHSVQDYRPENISVQTQSGQQKSVCVYNLPSPPVGKPNRRYAQLLADLAIRLELPPEYVAQIQRWTKLKKH